MKAKESIHYFEVANPKLTKTDFIVVGERHLYLVIMKDGLFGSAEAEVVKYNDIKMLILISFKGHLVFLL